MTPLHERDVDHLRHATEPTARSHERGDRPFGAVLVGEDGRALAEGENTQTTERHVTGHGDWHLRSIP